MRASNHRFVQELRILRVFMLSEFKSRTAYKTKFATSILSPIFLVISWVFMANSVEAQRGLEMYGNISPLAFMVSGAAIHYLVRLANQFVVFRPDMFYEYLTEPLPLWRQLLYRRIGLYVEGLLIFVAYMVGGVLIGMTLNMDLPAFILIIFLGSSVQVAYALMTSGYRLIVKVGDPVSFILDSLTRIFSGVMFPVTVLPETLRYVSWILPQTWIYTIARLTMFKATSVFTLGTEFAIISAVAIILLLTGYFVFMKGINEIKTEGLIL